MTRITMALALVLIAASGCDGTVFKGEAMFPGGAAGCYRHCAKQRMEMDSFVYMGEYSTACVCRPGPAHGHSSAAGSASGAAVGVILEREREAATQGAAIGAGVGAASAGGAAAH